MIIGGLQRSSLVDYPGLLSAIIFTQGCNFRCPYCHNPELVDPSRFSQPLNINDIFAFLKERRGKLDAVVITGGEPTIHQDLPIFIRQIREMGYQIKLDTNGTNPEMIETLLKDKLIDFLAMDIKAPLDNYCRVAGASVDTNAIRKSVEIISQAEVETEFRTTVIESLLSGEDIQKIALFIPLGRKFVIQRFQPSKTLDQSFLSSKSIPESSLENLSKWLSQRNINYHIR
jgi:pyruvate formate lyase activating enzyme